MGYVANWADVMEWDAIKSIVPEGATRLRNSCRR